MSEFEFIDAIKQQTYKQSSLIKGIGDDGAVIRELTADLIVSVDTFVENIHFSKETMEPAQIGYRLLAANFSDLAAMGAEPTYYLVSAVIPKHWEAAQIVDVFNGMKQLATKYSADLIGGDTVSGDSLILSITVLGRVEQEKVRYRHLARPGDVVFVTGTLGDSGAGLYLLQKKLEHEDRAYFVKRHQMPVPRIEFSRALQSIKRVALNDVSDGVASEANEIADASNVTLMIDESRIPVHPGMLKFPIELQEKWKLSGGEDFELLGTVSRKEWEHIQDIANQLQIKVTELGYVTKKDKHPVYIKRNGSYQVLEKTGYTHLK